MAKQTNVKVHLKKPKVKRAYLQSIATSEQGACFIAANGDLTFTDRLDASFASIAAEFSDAGVDIPYDALEVIYGQEFLFNRIQATVQGGAVQVANDAVSQAEFGITTLALSNVSTTRSF